MKKITAIFLTAALLLTLVAVQPIPVLAASKITLKSGAAAPSNVYAGHTYTLKVAGTSVKFTSSNKKVATIGLTSGKMKVLAPGSVKITAKNKKTGKAEATKTFKVLQRSTSVTAEPEEIVLVAGKNETIKATLTPATSTDVVRFYSENENICTVGAASGKVTAKSAGTTNIKVCAKATKATAKSSKSNKTAIIPVKVLPSLVSAEETGSNQIVLKFAGLGTNYDFTKEGWTEDDFTVLCDNPDIGEETEESGEPEDVIEDGGTEELTEEIAVSKIELAESTITIVLGMDMEVGKTYTVVCMSQSASVKRKAVVPTEIPAEALSGEFIETEEPETAGEMYLINE